MRDSGLILFKLKVKIMNTVCPIDRGLPDGIMIGLGELLGAVFVLSLIGLLVLCTLFLASLIYKKIRFRRKEYYY